MRELAFWVVVGLVAVVALALFKIGASSVLGDAVPGFRKLAAAL